MEEDAHSLWKTLDDLKPEERKVLVRRTRKLEQVLGESLSERDVGQHIVRPGRGTIDEICALGGDWMSVNTVRGRSGSESAVVSPSRSKHKWVADSHMHRSQSSHALALALGPDDDNENDSWLQGSPQDRENTTTNASWIKRAAKSLTQHAKLPSATLSFSRIKSPDPFALSVGVGSNRTALVLISQEQVITQEEIDRDLPTDKFTNRTKQSSTRRHSSPISPAFPSPSFPFLSSAFIENTTDKSDFQTVAQAQALKRLRRTQIAKVSERVYTATYTFPRQPTD